MSSARPLRVAIVGAGPAGIYAADILSKTELDVQIDLLERLPAPFGLVRYGVAPDHPHIKLIIGALEKVLGRGDIRLLGNIDVGTDITVAELQQFYDVVIFATGAISDVKLDIPGVDLEGSHGAADFVAWYDGHPDFPTEWPLDAQHIAVLGAGNVALDVARVLVKRADTLLPTEIPDNVHQGLAASPVTDVHIFARRGPAQAKFTPLELREVGKQHDVDVVVYPEDFEFDAASEAAVAGSNQVKQVVNTLTDWTLIDPAEQTASRRLHLHFLHAPVEVLGEDGKVVGLRTERTKLNGDGTVSGTGEFTDWPVQALYRAVGYYGTPVDSLPFNYAGGVISNVEGRVISDDGAQVPGIYATGWIKRGPVGLIGSTKSDAAQTINHLVADVEAAGEGARTAVNPDPQAIVDFLTERGLELTDWAGWQRLDAHEKELGAAQGRDRIKVVSRATQTEIAKIRNS